MSWYFPLIPKCRDKVFSLHGLYFPPWFFYHNLSFAYIWCVNENSRKHSYCPLAKATPHLPYLFLFEIKHNWMTIKLPFKNMFIALVGRIFHANILLYRNILSNDSVHKRNLVHPISVPLLILIGLQLNSLPTYTNGSGQEAIYKTRSQRNKRIPSISNIW